MRPLNGTHQISVKQIFNQGYDQRQYTAQETIAISFTANEKIMIEIYLLANNKVSKLTTLMIGITTQPVGIFRDSLLFYPFSKG